MGNKHKNIVIRQNCNASPSIFAAQDPIDLDLERSMSQTFFDVMVLSHDHEFVIRYLIKVFRVSGIQDVRQPHIYQFVHRLEGQFNNK